MHPAQRVHDASAARLRERIVEYLERNPEAADSVKGITNWWLADELADSETVAEVVLKLVAEGVMERRPMPDGAAIYGRRRDR